MSDAPAKKRCPNCAWAIGLADALQLPQEESWILTVIAENVVGADMQLHATMAELAHLTRFKSVTLSKHVRSLASRKVCITMVRSRDGYRYTLLRPPEAHAKPAKRPPMSYDDVADQELQNLAFSNQNVPDQELQNLAFPDPGMAKNDIQDPPKFAIPSNEESLESLKEERTPLTGGDAGARATNVVVMDRFASLTSDQRSVIDAWDAMADDRGLVPVVAATPSVRRQLNARIAEVGVEQLLTAVRMVGESAFCRGDNGREWMFDFGHLVNHDYLIPLLSGRYADRPGKGAQRFDPSKLTGWGAVAYRLEQAKLAEGQSEAGEIAHG